jgi:hypothetical protein
MDCVGDAIHQAADESIEFALSQLSKVEPGSARDSAAGRLIKRFK